MKSSEINPHGREHGSRFAEGSPFARSLRSAASAALIGLACLSASTTALAGIPGITASLTSLVPGAPGTKVISYSTGTATYQSAYELRIANTTSSNINNIFFTAVTALSTGAPPPFSPLLIGVRPGDICAFSAGGTELDCQFISLPAGSAPIVLTLLVPSPVAPADNADSTLNVGWTIQSGQGQANSSNLVYDLTEAITLKVGSPKGGVESYVLANTALGVTDGDSNTNVTPPKPVTVGVKQDINPNSCVAHVKSCFVSTITIVDANNVVVQFTDSPLTIDLLRAASSLRKNARFANAQLFYTGADGITYTIPTCDASNTVPATPPRRCITQAVPAGTAVPGQTGVDASGDWLFHILAGENGIINW